MYRQFSLAMTVFAFAATQSFAQSHFHFFEPVHPPRNIQVMVHRGMAKAAPENSAAAIKLCTEDFCEWVEIDLRLTKDGHHVVIHNETVDAVTDGKGRVAELTLEELQKLDAGSWFAKRFTGTRLLTLPEALALAKGKVNLYLDCKQIDPNRLVDEIVAAGMEQQVIVYDSPAVLAKIKERSQGRVPGMTKYRPQTMTIEKFLKEVGPAAVEINADEVTAELCQQFHAAGIKVQAQVLGEKSDNAAVWAKVIDAGVDWLQTDDPAGLLFFNARRKLGKFPVKIAAHRGVNRYAPENTVPAIREAARLGIDLAEIDIRTTTDGKHFLLHDGSLNRTTTGTGNSRDLTFAQTQALSAGLWFGKAFSDTRIPSFEDGLSALGDSMSVYLDAKDVAPEVLVAAIHKYRLEERHVVYQSLAYCDTIQKLDPQVRTIPPLSRLEQLDAVAAIKPYGVDAKWSILSREMIAACHQKGIQVFADAPGSGDDVLQFQQAIEWGIDCIQIDHPLRLLRAIELLAAKKSP
ncbi:glycerophosphodiester phosphodiesterase family protein [Schlesneria paludicola]|uniref:glycerophosphodiester phosphodiesterase family protein n=1 Tax=Schlesneria paludicola TaxID=360056 RepID=UPI00192B4891|nr:glycerophosphodiester phosphodiesterase family protein [Schlesneria paludicola]